MNNYEQFLNKQAGYIDSDEELNMDDYDFNAAMGYADNAADIAREEQNRLNMAGLSENQNKIDILNDVYGNQVSSLFPHTPSAQGGGFGAAPLAIGGAGLGLGGTLLARKLLKNRAAKKAAEQAALLAQQSPGFAGLGKYLPMAGLALGGGYLLKKLLD